MYLEQIRIYVIAFYFLSSFSLARTIWRQSLSSSPTWFWVRFQEHCIHFSWIVVEIQLHSFYFHFFLVWIVSHVAHLFRFYRRLVYVSCCIAAVYVDGKQILWKNKACDRVLCVRQYSVICARIEQTKKLCAKSVNLDAHRTDISGWEHDKPNNLPWQSHRNMYALIRLQVLYSLVGCVSSSNIFTVKCAFVRATRKF